MDEILRVYRFVGLTPPPERKIRRVLRMRLNAQRERDFPRPSEWEPGMVKRMLDIAGEEMEAQGYKEPTPVSSRK